MRELVQIELSAKQELAQAVDQFRGQISTARVLPTLIARSEIVVESFKLDQVGPKVKDYLTRAHVMSGAHEIRLLDAQGVDLVSTLHDEPRGQHLQTGYYHTAMSGALGVAISYDVAERIRTLTFARSILGDQGAQVGVTVLDVDLEQIETNFRARPYVLMLVDTSGTIVFSNRADLLFRNIKPALDESKAWAQEGAYPSELVTRTPITQQETGGVELWSDLPSTTSAEPWIVARQSILPLNLEAILLQETSSALTQANKLTSLFAITVAFALMTVFAIYQRRRRLIGMLHAEHKLNRELDRRIVTRSAELEQVQHQLVQAAKLSALGTMSAGISHELNQPIASIQNFAFMARRFIKDENTKATLANLVDIEKQTERMSRIIRNLRDFARKDDLPTAAVDICDIILQAAKLIAPRLEHDGVQLTLKNIDKAVIVLGGEVRLQQVLLNLIENAADALADQENKWIRISVIPGEDVVKVRVQDSGPGLLEPDRVFEPFYSTKSGAKDEGLGLGLSISYGFVESFGGNLRAINAPEGGACFTLSLPSATPADYHQTKDGA
jgi:two-component system C4-dicarboxylate transport sensor histidine kinase DctB